MFYRPTTTEDLRPNLKRFKNALQRIIDRNESDEGIKVFRYNTERSEFELVTLGDQNANDNT